MGLFGTVSDMIAHTSDPDLLAALDAISYRDSTKIKLIKNIRDSDKILTDDKNRFGNGVSVKGILVNVSAEHFLKRINLIQETGKSWEDPLCRKPTPSVGPLQTCAFFHGKAESSWAGCRGGFTVQVLDAKSVICAFISVAWENPLKGDFVYCCIVSPTHDNLQACLDYCDDNNVSKIEGDIYLKMDDGRLKQFITVNVLADNESTAYLLVGIKTDDLTREIIEGGL